MFDDIVNASITTPQVNAYTYPQGPRGYGIKSISQDRNKIIFTFDNGETQEITFPDWWFGSIEQYNALPLEDRSSCYLYFILDDI